MRLLFIFTAMLALSGCSLFEPMARMHAGQIVDRELADTRPQYQGMSERNLDLREANSGAIMAAPARAGAGMVGEMDLSGKGGGSTHVGQKNASTVRLEFDDASLKDVIAAFLRDYLKVPYSFLDSFKDRKVNLYFSATASRDELIALFDTLLENNGARMRYNGGVYYIGAADDKLPAGYEPSPIGMGYGVGVFRPRFIDGRDLQNLAKQVVKQADRLSVLGGNVVIVNSTSQDVRAVASLLADVDVPAFANKQVIVYIPKYLSATALVATLDAYQTQISGAQAAARPFEAKQVPESERIVIVAANRTTRDLVVEFLRQTDTLTANERRIFQYSLGTQLAADIVTNLNTLIKAAIKNQTEISVVADKPSNSLFIYATPDEFVEIRKLLSRMDYRPPAVQIDVIIAEVNLTKNMRYGVEWYLKSTGKWLADITTNMGVPKTVTDAGGAIVAGLVSPTNNYATLQLLGSETSFSLLSSPKIVVKNGATAKIAVGREQPVIKQKTINNASAGGNTVVEPEFKKIGLELEVTPFVTQANEVRMTIKLKDTSIVGTQTLGSDTYPILANREINTELVSSDGKTIFLGGIRKQDSNDIGSKTPGLGDLEHIGSLFRNKTMDDTGQELIVFATPSIILDQQGADLVTGALLRAAQRTFLDPRRKGDSPASAEPPRPDAPAATAERSEPTS